MNLETYPQRIVKPLIELEKTTDLASEHKLLLDLGETLLTHITGIICDEIFAFKGTALVSYYFHSIWS